MFLHVTKIENDNKFSDMLISMELYDVLELNNKNKKGTEIICAETVYPFKKTRFIIKESINETADRVKNFYTNKNIFLKIKEFNNKNKTVYDKYINLKNYRIIIVESIFFEDKKITKIHSHLFDDCIEIYCKEDPKEISDTVTKYEKYERRFKNG